MAAMRMRLARWMPALALACALGCAQGLRPAASPPPAPAPAPVVEVVQPAAPEPEPAPALEPSLHLGADGPRVGWLLSPDLEGLEPEPEPGGWIRLLPAVTDPRTRGALRAHVREEALGAPAPALDPPLRLADGHRFELQLDDGTPFARFYCAPMEVLVEEPGRTYVRVRARREPWVLEGWVEGPVEPRGDDGCPPRVVLPRTHVSRGPDGVEHPPPPEVPEGFVRAGRLTAAPRLRGPVWLRRWGDDGARICQRWRFAPRRGGLDIERRERVRHGRGLADERWFIPLQGGPVHFTMFGTGFERRWIRRPGPRDGLPGSPGATGCVTFVTVVHADDEVIRWVESRDVLAYHPDDAHAWYLTEAACEATLRDD